MTIESQVWIFVSETFFWIRIYNSRIVTIYDRYGHFSWIPALNNQCYLDYNKEPVVMYGKEVTLFEWISMQKKY